ncbi:MAG: hypothetical protein JWN39_1181, partial [Ilumatobacteraceae bacterium]|nr:hypothetical protein [Ilumatobacteraceae bacterium]
MRFALADDAPRKHRLGAMRALTDYLSKYDGANFDTYLRAPEFEISIQPSDLVAVTFLSMEIRRGTRSGFTPAMAVA